MSTTTDNATWPLLLEAASRHNVLALTSACNTSCVFCSHRQNPPGVLAYSIGQLDLEELGTLAEFLNPERKIVV